MSSKQNTPSLYGIQRAKQGPSKKDITSSSTLAFTSHLSSLIAKDAPASSAGPSKLKTESGGSYTFARGRARPSKSSKPDIFSVHNKGALKRAAADEAAGDSHDVLQVHQRSDTLGQIDAATLEKSKRRMAEKTDLYESLRKGHHLADGDSSDEDESKDDHVSRMRRKERNALVDFDRKWAEEEKDDDVDGDDEDNDEHDDDGTGSLVDYEDEFGRTRRGTRAEAAQAARLRKKFGATEYNASTTTGEDYSRPARPSNLIYGEAIQTQAFNPDAEIASQMKHLASKRDRSATPPESRHYDAEAEVRTRGTAFYKFSQDARTREQEMDDLLNVRRETEREREERGQRKAERERLKQERRAKIRELRGKRQAEKFLDGLGVSV